jgi:hypothetical protein
LSQAEDCYQSYGRRDRESDHRSHQSVIDRILIGNILTGRRRFNSSRHTIAQVIDTRNLDIAAYGTANRDKFSNLLT